jgi:hypothetical protein
MQSKVVATLQIVIGHMEAANSVQPIKMEQKFL